jgi:tryptophan synthase beta chain
MPKHWYNIAADLPVPPPPPLHPGTLQPVGPSTTWRRCSRWN